MLQKPVSAMLFKQLRHLEVFRLYPHNVIFVDKPGFSDGILQDNINHNDKR